MMGEKNHTYFAEAIVDLASAIQQTNKMIKLCEEQEKPDESAISDYKRRKSQYFEQLHEIFAQYEIEIQFKNV